MISIHAPLTGSDGKLDFLDQIPPYFNPRSPYGERPTGRKFRYSRPDFNPRSPYGERHIYKPLIRTSQNFNPRSPYGERLIPRRRGTNQSTFQSTLPLRGATYTLRAWSTIHYISIHAPLTGSDQSGAVFRFLGLHFNPRSPYGERLGIGHDILIPSKISIHAPLTGSDCYWIFCGTPSAIFQSTLPLRGATAKMQRWRKR